MIRVASGMSATAATGSSKISLSAMLGNVSQGHAMPDSAGGCIISRTLLFRYQGELQMPDYNYDIAVIGGGIVGTATAMQIALKCPNYRVGVIEKEDHLAEHQSGHNSGVIHSGIYYAPGSLKAKNCVVGAQRMKDFCDENNIKYDLCGKVIVATSEDE